MKKNIFFISYSYNKGGASIAANNFYNILNDLYFSKKKFSSKELMNITLFFKFIFSYILIKIFFKNKYKKYSLNIFSNLKLRNFISNNNSNIIYHVHWFGNNLIGIKDFTFFPNSTLITLHDELIYSDFQHVNSRKYVDYNFVERYFSKKIFKLKQENKINNIHISVPSNWMLNNIKKSNLFLECKFHLLPNPIDTIVFKKKVVFNYLNHIKHKDIFYIGFGAIDLNKKNKLKGVDLFYEIINKLEELIKIYNLNQSIKIVIFGNTKKFSFKFKTFEIINIGYIKDPNILSEIYNFIDLLIFPSRFESFGQVLAECLSCGTPAIAFDCFGQKDIIINNYNGFLIKPYDVLSFSNKIIRYIKMSDEDKYKFSSNAILSIQSRYSFYEIANLYIKILNKL
jgi:glycosyltransferase involved in cell wall biosynthesis